MTDEAIDITIPALSLVVLVGADGSGKSAFAAQHFARSEVVSFDGCLDMVADGSGDDESILAATELMHFVVATRLAAGRLTVVDAPNLHPDERRPLIMLAQRHHCVPVAIAFHGLDADGDVSVPGQDLGLKHQQAQLRRSLAFLTGEGMQAVHVVDGATATTTLTRVPMPSDHTDRTGPFDVIGDVHGCSTELAGLLQRLGWTLTSGERPTARHPEGRTAVFVGDLVDRGPDSPGVLALVMGMVEDGVALAVPGNHDEVLRRRLEGRSVRIAHGLDVTLRQLAHRDEAFQHQVRDFLGSLPTHLVLDGGRLVVAHAGLHAEFHNRDSRRVRDLALFGETEADADDNAPPSRIDWAADYRGAPLVVYGHTPVSQATWRNRTINLDTGCVFGGELSALRYPEHEVVSVPARQTWASPARPLDSPSAPRPEDSVLPSHVEQRHDIDTVRNGPIVIREEFANDAVDTADVTVDRRWLIYAPPTAAPPDPPSANIAVVERPHEAFEYYADAGVAAAICYDDPMGVRAVIVACRDEISAFTTFGADDGRTGVVYTRAGASAFADGVIERALVSRLRLAMEERGVWELLGTDWIALDCTLMPCTPPARSSFYAAFAQQVTSSLEAFRDADDTMLASQPGVDLSGAVGRVQVARRQCADAMRGFRWQPRVLDDLKVEVRAILATAGRVRIDADHTWHIQTIAELAHQDRLFRAPAARIVDLNDRASRDEATAAWARLDEEEGTGWTIAPVQWPDDARARVVPALRCRTPARLRLLYGDDCLAPERIGAMRRRNVRRKRSLSFREFALALEGLERFVHGEPHFRVHECVFGIFALEQEPIDPRL